MDLMDQSLGQLARSIPGATRVFHEHQLDFCCGGKNSLREAAAKKGLDGQAIASRIHAQTSQDPNRVDWRHEPIGDLIDHLLARYHETHRAQLTELLRLAQRVEQVHGDRPECPRGLTEHLRSMQQELESHMQTEEQVLFPMLRQGRVLSIRAPVMVMRAEHAQHGLALKRLSELTHGITLPQGACNTWRALYLGLQALREDLMEHIHLENNILFERTSAEPAYA